VTLQDRAGGSERGSTSAMADHGGGGADEDCQSVEKGSLLRSVLQWFEYRRVIKLDQGVQQESASPHLMPMCSPLGREVTPW